MIQIKDYKLGRVKAVVRLAESNANRSAEKALNVLKVGLWFEGLRARMGRPTAYRLGQVLQPGTYLKGEHHHNLWAKYALGKHVPGAETLRTTEAAMAGSSEILMAAAWDALDISRPVGVSADTLLKRLGPGIQMAIFDQQALERGRYVRRKATRQVTRRLEGQAGLDSLAALVVLLREAHEAGNQGRAFELGRSLHASLFLATIEGPLWEIAEELFAYFICFIFPLAEDKELAFDLHPRIMQRQAFCFSRVVLQLEDAGWDGYLPGGHTRQLRRLLTIDFGFDLFFGLGPRFRLTQPVEQSSENARRWVAEQDIAWEWGLRTLHAGRRERLMPDEVRDRIAASGA
ncbi:hypothetical protein [Xanthomonas hortorum]|uniref:Uncharacterized protein n=1 Tax=Xanthomonas hortorum pv. pelargonii TaxID=453602 RepID=A0A6V7B900_9XANT|nr:hypothetical protein [Xanthomonas hortorum]MCE4356404.1 hypothetical protein [Xanthomonas hortorum pv. pelargonii]MCM5525590.1 hypothetical protein [Xanthomonas hortorum pv. pelargonii]MCM5536819.1 hypothetical protein [Xanthomonas hortorum pv. pelargonii]MCM5541615.1 hypothetical protein [Xanthomonas hortorum pv. pelargonii]MCM5546707.1 hypothetical protein [Xanthomonas hortorum pv. pelargonii]